MNMTEVTKDVFYQAMGSKDVHPNIVGKVNDRGGHDFDGYATEWKTRERVLTGKSETRWRGENRYWLVRP